MPGVATLPLGAISGAVTAALWPRETHVVLDELAVVWLDKGIVLVAIGQLPPVARPALQVPCAIG